MSAAASPGDCGTQKKSPVRKSLLLASFGGLCVALMLAASVIGRYQAGPLALWDALFSSTSEAGILRTVFLDIRLPRIAGAALAGAALATAGAAYQGMFANPLVSPNLLGVLAGSGFGAALGLVAGASWITVQILSVLFGFAAAGIALGVAAAFRRSSDPVLLLVMGGILSGALFSALLAVAKFVADPYDKLPGIVLWLMGSFAGSNWGTIMKVAPPMLVSLALLVGLGGRLNVLSLGDEAARALGLNSGRIRLAAVLLATLLSSLTVMICGEIGWVGLIVPHVARMLVGPDNRVLLPASALLGASFLIAVDTFARTAFRVEIPTGILTALLGVAAFVFVLGRLRKGWS